MRGRSRRLRPGRGDGDSGSVTATVSSILFMLPSFVAFQAPLRFFGGAGPSNGNRNSPPDKRATVPRSGSSLGVIALCNKRRDGLLLLCASTVHCILTGRRAPGVSRLGQFLPSAARGLCCHKCRNAFASCLFSGSRGWQTTSPSTRFPSPPTPCVTGMRSRCVSVRRMYWGYYQCLSLFLFSPPPPLGMVPSTLLGVGIVFAPYLSPCDPPFPFPALLPFSGCGAGCETRRGIWMWDLVCGGMWALVWGWVRVGAPMPHAGWRSGALSQFRRLWAMWRWARRWVASSRRACQWSWCMLAGGFVELMAGSARVRAQISSTVRKHSGSPMSTPSANRTHLRSSRSALTGHRVRSVGGVPVVWVCWGGWGEVPWW